MKIAAKSAAKSSSTLSSKKAIVEKWLTQSVEEVEDSESSRESQTSIFDDLKTLRDENIKVSTGGCLYAHVLVCLYRYVVDHY